MRDGSGSRRAAEEAQAELAVANADLKAARDRLALASRGVTASGAIAIDAPFGGLLRNLHASAGQTVAAGSTALRSRSSRHGLDPRAVYVGESGDVDARAPARIVGLGDPGSAEGMLANRSRPRPQPIPRPRPSICTSRREPTPVLPARAARRRATDAARGEATLVVPRAALLHDAYGGTWVYEAREPRVYVRRRVSVVDIVDTVAVLDQGPAPAREW